MHPVELEHALKTICVLVDTREQNTSQLRKRLKAIDYPVQRQKLDFGDYSVSCTLPDGGVLSLADKVAIERKMNLDELCACYCKGRKRFEREFLRAKDAGAKVYLLIERGSWEDAFNGSYRSQMQPAALIASITAWLSRYNCQILFCDPDTTGPLIREILYRELKEHLEKYEQ